MVLDERKLAKYFILIFFHTFEEFLMCYLFSGDKCIQYEYTWQRVRERYYIYHTMRSDPKKCNFLRDDLLKDKIRIDMLFYTNKIVR